MDKKRIIFHIDVNNAFLSWTAVKLLEEGYNKDIRNCVSVIGGDESKRHGIVLSKSPLAKKYGIQSAETLYSARKKYKNLVVFPASFDYYEKKSKELFKYLSRYTPAMEIFSIDECFLDFTDTAFLYSDYIFLAYKIKDDIFNKFGYTVNIGIANNKLCAKMASDLEKPNKVHTLFDEEFRKKIWDLDVSNLFMIGKKTYQKLLEYKIYTIRDLALTDLQFLKLKFKSQGVMMHEYSNGIDNSEVISNRSSNKILSVSETLEKDISNKERLKKILLSQSKKIAFELKKKNQAADTVTIILKTYDFNIVSKQKKLHQNIYKYFDIYNNAINLLDDVWNGIKIRNIGIRVNLCNKEKRQISLFETSKKEDDKIEKIIEDINFKYGNEVVTFLEES